MARVKVKVKSSKIKQKNIDTKRVYYAIVECMDVPVNMSDEQIDDLLMIKATDNGMLDEGKDYMWSYKDDLLFD